MKNRYEEYEAHAAADLAHPPPELEQRVAEGVGVAGPLGVVELDHLPLLPVLPQPDRPAGAGGGLVREGELNCPSVMVSQLQHRDNLLSVKQTYNS